MATGKKLALGAVIITSVSAYMAYVGASRSWQYYLTVDECLASAATLIERPIRVNGKVSANPSPNRHEGGATVFFLEGTSGKLQVYCSSPLPDNFAPHRDVVVEGQLESQTLLRSEKVLTRCASKYQSNELAASQHSSAGAEPKD